MEIDKLLLKLTVSEFKFLCVERLRRCFAHLKVTPICDHHVMVLLLVVHVLLGYRELRDSRYYQDDEMVKRLLGAEARMWPP